MNNEINNPVKILLAEDEESLAKGLIYNLNDEGYVVDWASEGKMAVRFFETRTYDLIILDIMLPYLDGFEIAEKIRCADPQMPILMLTARTSGEDKVRGLLSGADDYITKPFHLEELMLRIKGMLKRKTWYKNSVSLEKEYSFGNNSIDFESFKCKSGSRQFQLTQREAMVMKYLIERKGKIVTRKELLENVWHINPDIETRTIDNFISRLRKYFEPDPDNPVYIKGVRSAGYEFDQDSQD